MRVTLLITAFSFYHALIIAVIVAIDRVDLTVLISETVTIESRSISVRVHNTKLYRSGSLKYVLLSNLYRVDHQHC